VFLFSKRSGRRAEVRFFPGLLLLSVVASIAITILLNVLIRVF
jgi:hypothetical protein